MTLTVGTKGPIGLKPGKSMEVSYKLDAPDPSPANERVDAPARFQFRLEQFGPVCVRDAPEAPSVRVSHLRRNFSAGKQAIPMGGKGRYEVLILFENNGDTALQDVFIRDVIPSNFEIKDWHIRGAGGEKRNDVEMTTNQTEEGVEITWKVPVVAKGERLDVSFDIKGEGEIDAEALNRFHGAHFGDELETEDEEVTEEIVEESAEEVDEESAEEASEDKHLKMPRKPEAPAIKFREDIMLRVMEEYGIEDRDAFLAHSMNSISMTTATSRRLNSLRLQRHSLLKQTIPKQAKRNLRMLKIQKKKRQKKLLKKLQSQRTAQSVELQCTRCKHMRCLQLHLRVIQNGSFHCGHSSWSDELLTMMSTLRFVFSSSVLRGSVLMVE